MADSNLSKEPDGRTIARIALDVPLSAADSIVDQIKFERALGSSANRTMHRCHGETVAAESS